MKKLAIFLFGIVLGVTLTLGGAVIAGYLLLTKITLGQVDQMIGSEVLAPEDSNKNTTLWDFSRGVYACFSQLNEVSIGEFETTIGSNALSHALNKYLGVNPDEIVDTSLPDLPDAIIESFTLDKISIMFGVDFPDFPLFKNPEFLDAPITEAFGKLSEQTLDSFIVVVYEGEDASSPLLQKLGKLTLDELSTDMDAVISDLYLSDIITEVDEGSLISHFMHLKVGEMGTKANDVINALTLKELITIDENSPKVMQALKDCSLVTAYDEEGNVISYGIQDKINTIPLGDLVETGTAPIWNKLAVATLDSLGGIVDDLMISDVMIIDENTHIIVKKLVDNDTKVSDIGSALGGVLATTEIGELIEIGDDAAPILKALKNTVLTGEALNDRINELEVTDIFENADSGVLALVPKGTKLPDLPAALTTAIATTNIYKLHMLDVYQPNFEGSTHIAKGYIYNLTIEALTNDFISSLSTVDASLLPTYIPIGNPLSQDPPIEITNEYVTQLIQANNGKRITLLLLSDAVIPDNTVFTQLFNISVYQSSNPLIPSASLTIGENVKVLLGEGDTDEEKTETGYMYIEGYGTENGVLCNQIEVNYFSISKTEEKPCVMIECFKDTDAIPTGLLPQNPVIP